jgi:CheY-like chemotaxis protein
MQSVVMYDLPEMDGVEASCALLALPDWHRIPIIAMTGPSVAQYLSQ